MTPDSHNQPPTSNLMDATPPEGTRVGQIFPPSEEGTAPTTPWLEETAERSMFPDWADDNTTVETTGVQPAEKGSWYKRRGGIAVSAAAVVTALGAGVAGIVANSGNENTAPGTNSEGPVTPGSSPNTTPSTIASPSPTDIPKSPEGINDAINLPIPREEHPGEFTKAYDSFVLSLAIAPTDADAKKMVEQVTTNPAVVNKLIGLRDWLRGLIEKGRIVQDTIDPAHYSGIALYDDIDQDAANNVTSYTGGEMGAKANGIVSIGKGSGRWVINECTDPNGCPNGINDENGVSGVVNNFRPPMNIQYVVDHQGKLQIVRLSY